MDGLEVSVNPLWRKTVPSVVPCRVAPPPPAPDPERLLVGQVLPEPDRIVILSRPNSLTSVCPLCGAASARVHSHYQRALTDLQGRIVALRGQAPRFRCATCECQRRVFAEHLPEVAVPRARRTGRLADVQRQLASPSAARLDRAWRVA